MKLNRIDIVNILYLMLLIVSFSLFCALHLSPLAIISSDTVTNTPDFFTSGWYIIVLWAFGLLLPKSRRKKLVLLSLTIMFTSEVLALTVAIREMYYTLIFSFVLITIATIIQLYLEVTK